MYQLRAAFLAASHPFLVVLVLVVCTTSASAAEPGSETVTNKVALTSESGTTLSAGGPSLACRLFGIGCPAAAKPAPKPAPATRPNVPTISATITAGDIRVDHAVAWAKSQVGNHGYDGWCLAFVEAAYGTSGGSPTAFDYWLKLGRPNAGADPNHIPVGAIVFFGPSAPGHAGLSLGNGTMVSALDRGPQTGVRITPVSYAKAYAGWAMPPASWPGR